MHALQTACKWLLALLSIIIIFGAVFPFFPFMPAVDLDSSWVWGMNQAIAQKMLIGKDIIFTFGPFASVYTKAYHPESSLLMFLGSTYFATMLSILTVFWISQVELKWSFLFLALFAYNIFIIYDGIFFLYGLLCAICCYLLTNSKNKNHHTFYNYLFGLAFSALGFLPIIKASNLLLSLVFMALCAVYLWIFQFRKLAVAAVILPFFSMPLFWILSGNSVGELYGYLVNSNPIIFGYTEAMAVYPDDEYSLYSTLFYLIFCICIFTFFLFKNSEYRKKIFLILSFYFYLFLSFKHGFIRHDAHVFSSVEAVLVSAILTSSIGYSKFRYVLLLMAIFIVLFIDTPFGLYEKTQLKTGIDFLSSRYRFESINNLDSKHLKKKYAEAVEQYKTSRKLPLLQGTSDVYNYNQGILIASGNTWNPRPIFQSYSAYSTALAEKNRQHLLGPNAPDNIFFAVETIDGRLPTLDDGPSWPELYARYDPVSMHDNFLLLTRKPNQPQQDILGAPIQTIQGTVGTSISVPPSSQTLFCKIDIQQNWLGKLANTLYKPGPLYITLHFDDNSTQQFRIVSQMAKAGFILSPFVSSTQEFANNYEPRFRNLNKRVKSFEISIGKYFGRLWKKTIAVEFYDVAVPAPTKQAVYQQMAQALENKPTVVQPAQCLGNIETLRLVPGELATIKGWVASSLNPVTHPVKPIAILTMQDQFVPLALTTVNRPDVAQYFQKPHMDNTGFKGLMDLQLAPTATALTIGLLEGETLQLCTNLSAPLSR